MSAVVEAINEIFNFPEAIENFIRPNDSNRPHPGGGGGGSAGLATDIVEAPNEYIFYMDVPGLSKSDIQVTVEEQKTLVVKGNGKRKREDEEGCKYIRLERRPAQKLMRKFRLPENCNAEAISAKCENGVLRVAVEKLPPPPKRKTVQVAIS